MKTITTITQVKDSALNEKPKFGKGQKMDFSQFGKMLYFKIQTRGLVGTIKNRRERKVGAYALLAVFHGGYDKNGKDIWLPLQLISNYISPSGMRIKTEFATYEEAHEAGIKYKALFGNKALTTKAKAPKAKAKAPKAEAPKTSIDLSKLDAKKLAEIAEALKALGIK